MSSIASLKQKTPTGTRVPIGVLQSFQPKQYVKLITLTACRRYREHNHSVKFPVFIIIEPRIAAAVFLSCLFNTFYSVSVRICVRLGAHKSFVFAFWCCQGCIYDADHATLTVNGIKRKLNFTVFCLLRRLKSVVKQIAHHCRNIAVMHKGQIRG